MPSLDHRLSSDLLQAVEKLSAPDWERFVERVIALDAHRRAPGLSREETRLLEDINRGLPQEIQDRMVALTAKRREESLSAAEHAELVRLTDRAEALQADRLERLAELAALRQIPLRDLMNDLGISTMPDG